MDDPTDILMERNAEVEKIKGFVDLTDEAKDRRIREVDERANAAYAKAKERQRRQREERLQRTERAVFSVIDAESRSASASEKAQLHDAYRRASADVYWATTEPGEASDELQRLLTQAERSGDSLMAPAAYHRAIDLGHQPTIDAYLERRPQENRAWERYTEAYSENQAATDITALLGEALTERALNE
jgi:hypothetical protein